MKATWRKNMDKTFSCFEDNEPSAILTLSLTEHVE